MVKQEHDSVHTNGDNDAESFRWPHCEGCSDACEVYDCSYNTNPNKW